VTVLSRNLFGLVAAPLSLLTGYVNSLTVSVTILGLIWCLFVRRQLVPDLFVALYCLAIACFIAPPERAVAPVLPLLLWMVWRVLRRMKAREPLVALVLIVLAIPLGVTIQKLTASRNAGYFPGTAQPAESWAELQKIFGFLSANSPADSVVLANNDALTFVNTRRKAVRGFNANGFDLYYSPRQSPVAPDQLSKEIVESNVRYLVLTPDRGFPESASFHRSVEALQRGRVIEPVSISGLAAGYSLFRVAAP